MDTTTELSSYKIPLFGARKLARRLIEKLVSVQKEHDQLRTRVKALGIQSALDLEDHRGKLQKELLELESRGSTSRAAAATEEANLNGRLASLRTQIVLTEDIALLQEAGVYKYAHPLSDAVQYASRLKDLDDQISAMAKKDGGAILCAVGWQVNGSEAQGRAMIRDFSKLMLRAFNAEADNLVRGLKPYKVHGSVERLIKVSQTIEKLGKTMQIRIAGEYLALRIKELELTADYLQKEAEEKELERAERERLKEERKAQQEIEREKARLEKERAHYENALRVLQVKGDSEGISRLQAELSEVNKALADVDYRAANIRAGYVYVISNIGSFGESVVKVGMTRRLDPMDRIRELSDASVPFNFDVHALFFSKDAVGIETKLHGMLAQTRINSVNHRREFFAVSPLHVKSLLATLTGELLQFQDVPEALEYRQCRVQRSA